MTDSKHNLPYGRQCLDDDDIQAVVDVLRSDWLTTGPKVGEFEKLFADFTGTREAVAVNNGTAALHAAMYAIGIKTGDEVIVPTMTFAATANCVVFQGATPVFADVTPDTLLIDPVHVETRISPKTKAIIAVDYAGHPCDYDSLANLAQKHGITLVSDACHALGGSYKNRPVGSLAKLSSFSFHPVKPITTGEGGMITTDDRNLAERMRLFRNHGIASDHFRRQQTNTWFYEMVDLGFNYRMTDFQCALGSSQLKKLPGWVIRRNAIAMRYTEGFRSCPAIQPLTVYDAVSHAYHLYVIQIPANTAKGVRDTMFAELRRRGIGVNVHYVPVHLHPFYRKRFGTVPGMCPVAEAAYDRILSLPIFPAMTDADVDRVVTDVCDVFRHL